MQKRGEAWMKANWYKSYNKVADADNKQGYDAINARLAKAKDEAESNAIMKEYNDDFNRRVNAQLAKDYEYAKSRGFK